MRMRLLVAALTAALAASGIAHAQPRPAEGSPTTLPPVTVEGASEADVKKGPSVKPLRVCPIPRGDAFCLGSGPATKNTPSAKNNPHSATAAWGSD